MTDSTETLRRASEIWEYMAAFKSRQKSDAVVICCSYDLRVCDHACDLLKDGIADHLVISGEHGNWTKHLWEKLEAEIFYERALANGINQSQIQLEMHATNFGENIRYSKDLIPDASTVTFVSKPNSMLRLKLTAEVQWPEVNTIVSCPDVTFPTEVSNIIGLWGVIYEMVGDIDRIQKYPGRGFQNSHLLPDNIMQNWAYLKDQMFTAHLIPDAKIHPATD